MQEQLADLSRRIESLIRIGVIADVDLAAARVRVQSGGLLTRWLPWCERRAASTATWNPPVVGEQVVLLCPSGNPATGIVLIGLESDDHPPPSQDGNKHVTEYPDGAVISYDHASSHLEVSGIKRCTVSASDDVTATGMKTANIIASTKVTIDCPENEITGNVLIGGNLLVKGTATITKLLTYMAGLAGFGGSGGAGTVIRGPISQTEGGFTSDHDVVAAGVSLKAHQHNENGTGGGVTSAPIGGGA